MKTRYATLVAVLMMGSIASADTFFSGFMDFNGTVAGGTRVDMARLEGQAQTGASYNNRWTGGGAPADGQLLTTIGVIPIVSAQTNAGLDINLGTGNRLVAVYAAQAVTVGPNQIGDFDPSASVPAATSPTGSAIPSRGVIKIYDRGALGGANPGVDSPLNPADPTTWVADFSDLSVGIVGELIIDFRADMPGASGDVYNAGLPQDPGNSTTLFASIDPDLINTAPFDPVGAFSGIRIDMKALINENLIGNGDPTPDPGGFFFKNPITTPDPAELPPGFDDWVQQPGAFGYGDDDLLIRLEQILLETGFPQPDEQGFDDIETLFDFLLQMHPDAANSAPFAGTFRFQDETIPGGDYNTQQQLGEEGFAATGDAVFTNTGGAGIPGAQFQARPVQIVEPEPSAILVWTIMGMIGLGLIRLRQRSGTQA